MTTFEGEDVAGDVARIASLDVCDDAAKAEVETGDIHVGDGVELQFEIECCRQHLKRRLQRRRSAVSSDRATDDGQRRIPTKLCGVRTLAAVTSGAYRDLKE